MRRRVPSRLALAGAAALLAAGWLPAARAETAVESIARSGSLHAVVIGDDPPLLRQGKGGYEGLAMEVLNGIRQELQPFSAKPLTITPVPVNSVEAGIEALTSGKADIACGVSFAWERAMVLDYTLPFALGGVRLLAPAGIDGTPASLAGQRVGVLKGSVAEQVLKAAVPGIVLVPFNTPELALAAQRSGQVRILGGDSLWLQASRANAAAGSQLVPTYPYARAAIACVVPENNSTLLNYSNIAIGRLLHGYLQGDAAIQARINRWIGPGSAANLNPELIREYYAAVLSTSAQLAQPDPGSSR